MLSGNIEVTLDDLGRLSVSRGDAKRLFDERRENQAPAREVAARQELQAIEADQRFRAQLPHGLPWYEVPDDVSPAAAMFAADRAARPRRTSVLEDSLSREGTVFHPFPQSDDEE